MKAASLVVFPGQGSQFPGMGKAWFDNFPSYRETIEEASDACGLSIKNLSLASSEAEIRDTEIAQPLILAVSYGIWNVLCNELGLREKIDPVIYAGHSLGEYTALVCAGAMDFADAVATVQLRGRYMNEACPTGMGGMRALILKEPVTKEQLDELCRSVSDSTAVVSLANWNTDTQVVVSGHVDGLKKVDALVGQESYKWIRRSISLDVSGPFHSPLMEPATEKLGRVLDSLEFEIENASVLYVPNVTGEVTPLEFPVKIKNNLVAQVSGAVRWYPGLLNAKKFVTHHVEIGASKVLTNMASRIDALKEWKFVHFENPLNMDEVIAKN